jgi:hypothetical protein
MNTMRLRRVIATIITFGVAIVLVMTHSQTWQPNQSQSTQQSQATGAVVDALNQLEVKGRAPKTGYARTLFGNGWRTTGLCDTRNIILHRDMPDSIIDDKCHVLKGTLHDPYTGKIITFSRGDSTSAAVQLDHVVALGDAWQKGAQQLSANDRENLANDPLELLAVDGPANQQKSDADAATWLPPNRAFRCQYVARQIAVKVKYKLWVTSAEKDAMNNVLVTCPAQAPLQ